MASGGRAFQNSGLLIDSRQLLDGLKTMNGKLNRAVGATMEYHAPGAESHAKNNAPWTDQTSNARNGLSARAYHDGSVHGIVVFHQVPYGIWLEVKQEGRFAIIMPTVLAYGPRVMQTLTNILGRL